MQRQLLQVPFAGGVDSKTDSKQVQSVKLLDLQNGVFQKTGAVNKRWGYSALGKQQINAGAPISACKAINTFGSELLLYDGSLAYSYIPAVDAWANRGTVISVIQGNQAIVRNTSQQLAPDHAQLNGVDVFAWEDSRGGVRYSVFDAASGAAILADQQLVVTGMATANLRRPKCTPFALSNSIGIFVVDPGGTLGCCRIPTSAPTTTISRPVLSVASLYYDITTGPDGVVYGAQALLSGGNMVLFTIDQTALTVSASTLLTLGSGVPTGPPALSIDPSNTAGWVVVPSTSGGFAIATAAVFFVGSFALGAGVTVFTSPISGAANNITSISIVAGPYSATSAFISTIYIDQGSATGSDIVWSNTLNNSLQAGTQQVVARGVGLASKAFVFNGTTYLNVATQTQQQSTYFTIRASDGVVIAKALAGLGGGYIVAFHTLPECQQVSAGVFQYASLAKSTYNTEAGQVLALLGVNRTQLDLGHSNSFLSKDINGLLYTVGGILQSYDGTQYVEHGFHMYPEGFTLTPSASGGSMATGNYFYTAVYSWTDNTGGVQVSTPGIPLSVAVTGPTGSVSVVVPTLRLTSKNRVRVEIYRTQASGTILYRVTSAALPTYNDPTVDTITFVDTLADASIASNGLLYTQQLALGTNPVQPNAAPPACSLITTFANRLWLAGIDDPYTLVYSQQAISQANAPSIPMQFGALFTLKVDPDGGPITAIARLDDKLIIFKRSGIYYLTGQGPTSTGDQNDFGTPLQIQSGNVGCANPNSVVSLPIGLMFQSQNGIYLLDRGLNVSYKGAPVEAYNSMAISSAQVIPNNWVVFTSVAGALSPVTGTTVNALVYDYYYDQWSTFSNHAAVDGELYLGGGNVYVYARSDGTVLRQTTAVFSDAGTPIPFSLTTAWFTPKVQGFQRIYHAFVLGTYRGTHTLRVGAGFDYDNSFSAFAAIPSDATLGLSTFGAASPFGSDSPFGGLQPGSSQYQYRLDFLRKCEAFRLQISDIESPPGNEAFSLSMITLDLGIKRGGMKLPAGRQFGVT